MPYVPIIRFQGDTSNFYRYPDTNSFSELVSIDNDPFNNW